MGFKKERVVPLVGMNGEVGDFDFRLLQVGDELRLFLGIEAKIGVDGKDEKLVLRFFGGGKKSGSICGTCLVEGIVR